MSQANMLYNYTEHSPQEGKMDITAEFLWYEMSRAQRLVRLHLVLAAAGGEAFPHAYRGLSSRMPENIRAWYWLEGHPRKWALDTDRHHEVIILPSCTVPVLQLLHSLPSHYFLLTYRRSSAEDHEDAGVELFLSWKKKEGSYFLTHFNNIKIPLSLQLEKKRFLNTTQLKFFDD